MVQDTVVYRLLKLNFYRQVPAFLWAWRFISIDDLLILYYESCFSLESCCFLFLHNRSKFLIRHIPSIIP